MKRRTLGKTGIEVSPICVGAWQLAGALSFDGKPDGHPDPGKSTVLRMIRELGAMGINFIDTAEQYGNGESERRVGEAIGGERNNWIISTKFGYRVGPIGTRNDSSHPDTITPSIEGSLKRLQTDYIDVYLYHCPPSLNELAEGKAVLDKLVQQGKCRFYGISTNNIELIKAMLDLDMLDVLQYHANILHDQPVIQSLVSQHNVGTQVRGVMAQGRLSGKYFKQQPIWDANDNRSHNTRGDNYQRYAAFEKLLPDGYTMAQAAIRWMLDAPCNHSICLGAKNLEDYKTAIQAIDLPPMNTEKRNQFTACAADLLRK